MKLLGCDIIFNRLKLKWKHVLFSPIRVFVFHQVSEQFDEQSMWACDWTEINQFKEHIRLLQNEYTFISLHEAYFRLQNDWSCKNKFAVLTADDGWRSILNVLPWLCEQQIPITLFLNPRYLDGIHKQERETEKLLSLNDISNILDSYPNVSIASHGWNHKSCKEMSDEEFEEDVIRSNDALSSFKRFIPFYAFTFGKYNDSQLDILQKHQLIPVLVDGMKNHKGTKVIHRECIDGK